jgi:Cu/Ag efflux protein CusF
VKRIAFLLSLLIFAGAAAARDGKPNEGIVRAVDKSTKEIIIRHGPLNGFDMPPMTMVFEVKDAAFLDKVKPGDRVRFEVEILNGRFTVTEIQRR